LDDVLHVSEIFRSIQGESSRAGLPCKFVRLRGCNLHCRYCDTRYAADEEGEPMSVAAVVERLASMEGNLTCITGGEPLLQTACRELCSRLLATGQTVLVETNGSLDLSVLPSEVVRVMDVKCPGSGHAGTTLSSNLSRLKPHDEVKFVISDRPDFEWAVRYVNAHGLLKRAGVLFAPVHGCLSLPDLAGWILEVGLDIRLQPQLHKLIWPHGGRGL